MLSEQHARGVLLPQVPQFLLESGYGCRNFPERAGMIGVTQPRRLAAISSAQRVAAELGQQGSSRVGHQVCLAAAGPCLLESLVLVHRVMLSLMLLL